jgi:hypothetical protein
MTISSPSSKPTPSALRSSFWSAVPFLGKALVESRKQIADGIAAVCLLRSKQA